MSACVCLTVGNLVGSLDYIKLVSYSQRADRQFPSVTSVNLDFQLIIRAGSYLTGMKACSHTGPVLISLKTPDLNPPKCKGLNINK